MIRKNSNNVRLAAAISLAIFSNQSLFAGDVEISLPAATDAFTVDQPVGTELMRVNGDGNVGIGTAAPASKLDVTGGILADDSVLVDGVTDGGALTSLYARQQSPAKDGAARVVVRTATAGAAFQLYEANSTGDAVTGVPKANLLSLNSWGATGVDNLLIGTGTAPIHFYNGDPLASVKMSILPITGNVGIGTMTPNEKLEVDGKIQVTAGNDVCIAGGPCLSNASGGSSKFVDGTVATDAVYTTGNVGIGTATPAAMLDVAGTVRSTADYFSPISGLDGAAFYAKSNNPAFALMDTNATNGWYIEAQSTGALTFNTDDEAGPNRAEHVQLTKEGNVGIGIVTPNAVEARLVVVGDSTNMALKVNNTATGDGISINTEATTLNNGLVWSAGNNLMFNLFGNAADTAAMTLHSGGVVQTRIHSAGNTYFNGGNVGIGTDDPQQALSVINGDISGYTNLDIAGAFGLHLRRSRGTNTAPTDVLSGDDLGNLLQLGYAGGAYRSSAQISFRVDGTPGSNYVPSRMQFETTADTGGTKTVRMVIKNDGQVGIGTTSPSEKLEVAGNVLATAHTTTSDKRLKKDIAPLENSLDKIKKLQGVSFKWKDEEKYNGDVQLGLIAQDVEKVIPEIVLSADDEQKTRSVNYTSLIAVLIEGMKEQQAEITAQQKRIEALEAKLEQ